MALLDRFGRRITYLRVSVTDRCNLRCVYCMPAEGIPLRRHDDILRYEEIVRVVRAAVGMGMRFVRLTGGEPAARRGLTHLVAMLRAIPGLEELTMTTNGTLLAAQAQALAEAGLDRVNISLDTLHSERFRRITRLGELKDVLAGIEAILGPLSPTQGPSGNGPAHTFQLENSLGTVGLITLWSQHFCPSCNRLRLTADGRLRPCLLSEVEVDLRGPLRRGVGEAELERLIQRAVELKPARHHLEELGGPQGRAMSEIGG